MASLLSRLGTFSARRAWLVIVVWSLVLIATVGGAFGLGGKLSSSMTLDGTAAQSVIDQLEESFPSASRGSAQMVFHKTNGVAFTQAEIAAIDKALAQTTEIVGVDGVANPFTSQATKDAKVAQLTSSRAQLDAAPAQLAAAQSEIDSGWAQIAAAEAELASGQEQVSAGSAQATSVHAELMASKTALQSALAGAIAAGAPQVQIDGLTAQLQQVVGGLVQVDASLQTLSNSQSTIDQGRYTLAEQKAQLTRSGATLATSRADLPAQTERLAWGEALLSAATNYRAVSLDQQTALGAVYFSTPMSEVSPETKEEVIASLSALSLPGVSVDFSKDLATSLGSIVGPGEIVGLVIAGIVLFVMLGTFVAAGLPVLTALLGVGVSALGAFALSAFIDMNSTTPTLAVMLGLAVGIDYSLFILNRHRRQLKTGMGLRESIALANGTSGSAVLFAGITVMIALLALNLTGIGFLGLMGTVAAAAIAIAVLAALTFTPAIMVLSGLKVLSRKERRVREQLIAGETPIEKPRAVARAKREVWAAKRPIIALVLTVGVLLVAAIPFGSMRLGLADGSSEPVESTQYQAYQLTSEGFGAGQNGQITAAVSFDRPLSGDDLLKTQASVATTLMSVENVQAVVTGQPSPDGKTLAFSVVPTEGPAARSTETVVTDLRAEAATIAEDTRGVLGVTGMAAVNIDISQKLASALPLYLATILGLSILLMILVFRSIAVPIVASLGFLISVFATLGAVTAVYQWGWFGTVFGVHDPGPIMNFLPTILIGVLFGLAMDYQLFIATGIREAFVHGQSPRAAITQGVRAGRAVVIAAAIIMIAVFGSFAFAESSTIRPMGFGLAFGVLVDAFLVRLLMVPAALRLLGPAAWWLPRWLDRLLPDLDVEGAKMQKATSKESFTLVA
jgi:RND superfamily putative drug exporter